MHFGICVSDIILDMCSDKETKAKLNMRLYKTSKQKAFAQFRKLLKKLNAAYLVGEDIFKW